MTNTKALRYRKFLAISVLLVLMFNACLITTYAAGNVAVKDLFTCILTEEKPSTNEKIEVADWSKIVAEAEMDEKKVSEYNQMQFARHKSAIAIRDTFQSQAAYDKAVAKVRSTTLYNGKTDELTPINTSVKGEQDLSRAKDKFNANLGSLVADQTINGIFDTGSFNPSAGAAAPFLDTFYMIVNTIFYVVSNVVIWWFLAQTSFDMLYIMCEPLRPLIGPSKSGGGGGFSGQNASEGWQKTVSKAINILHLCSEDAANACGGGSSGFGTQNAGSKNPWFAYFKTRAPVVIAVGSYLVLVSTGWWPKIIAWVAGLVTRLLGMFIG
ncbi:MAG: hypothetical protein RSC43_00940 [Clostridia bacterium]